MIDSTFGTRVYIRVNTIPNIDSLPLLATGKAWADVLGVSTRTLARAEKNGLAASRPNQRTVVYQRDNVLKYFLGIK